MTEVPPIKFSCKTKPVLNFELASHDLPAPPIQWGGKHRTTVTRYADDAVSIQSHGIDLEVIELKGDLKDGRWGYENYAQFMREKLNNLMIERTIVHLEYGKDRLWGLFEVTFNESRRDWVEYSIKFTPYFTKDPDLVEVGIPIESISSLNAKMRAHIDIIVKDSESPPDSIIDTAFLGNTYKSILSFSNKANEALSLLDDVASFGELSLELADQVKNLAFQSVGFISTSIDRINKVQISAISKPGAYLAQSADYVWTLNKDSLAARRDLMEIIRRIIYSRKPKSTKTYTVRLGDTLQSIAAIVLGDFNRWTEIADINDLENAPVSPGQQLTMPVR